LSNVIGCRRGQCFCPPPFDKESEYAGNIPPFEKGGQGGFALHGNADATLNSHLIACLFPDFYYSAQSRTLTNGFPAL
jgi:hypothetical protein